MASTIPSFRFQRSTLSRFVCPAVLLVCASNTVFAQYSAPRNNRGTLNQIGRVFGLGYSDGYHAAAPRKFKLSAELPPRQIWQTSERRLAGAQPASPGHHSSGAPAWFTGSPHPVASGHPSQGVPPSTIHVAPRSAPQFPPASPGHLQPPKIEPPQLTPRRSTPSPDPRRSGDDSDSESAISPEEIKNLPDDPPPEIITTPTPDDVTSPSDFSEPRTPSGVIPPDRLETQQRSRQTPSNNQTENDISDDATASEPPQESAATSNSPSEPPSEAAPAEVENDPLKGNLLPDGVDPYLNPEQDPLESLQTQRSTPGSWRFHPASVRVRPEMLVPNQSLSSRPVAHRPVAHRSARSHVIVEPPR